MSWMPDFSYVKSAFKDNGKDAFKYMRKKGQKKEAGTLAKDMGVETKALVDVNKEQKGF